MPVTKRKSGKDHSNNGLPTTSEAVAEKPIRQKRSKSSENKPKLLEAETHSGFCSRCIGVMKYAILFVLVPPFLNYTALIQESSQLIADDGFLYDIGFGQKLYLQCQGSGPPTVVLDASTGMNSDVWFNIIKDLSSVTKVCRYDRAGIGHSDRPFQNYSQEGQSTTKGRSFPFTVERMADDLHKLVTYSSQQSRPLVLVGAELGSLVSLFYTQIYESDVSDVILINPLSDELFLQENQFFSKYWQKDLIGKYQMLQLAAASGLSRFALMCGLLDHPLAPVSGVDLPVQVLQRQKHLMCNPRHLSSVVDEHYFINETLSQMRTILMMKSFPTNISLTVLTSNTYDSSLPSTINKVWSSSQKSLQSKLPPSTRFIQVPGVSDRHVIWKRSSYISETVKQIIQNWRSKNGLS